MYFFSRCWYTFLEGFSQFSLFGSENWQEEEVDESLSDASAWLSWLREDELWLMEYAQFMCRGIHGVMSCCIYSLSLHNRHSRFLLVWRYDMTKVRSQDVLYPRRFRWRIEAVGSFIGEMLEQKCKPWRQGMQGTKSLHVGGTPELRGTTEIRGFSLSPIPKRTGKVSGNFVKYS